jgi:hypothetical protein
MKSVAHDLTVSYDANRMLYLLHSYRKQTEAPPIVFLR